MKLPDDSLDVLAWAAWTINVCIPAGLDASGQHGDAEQLRHIPPPVDQATCRDVIRLLTAQMQCRNRDSRVSSLHARGLAQVGELADALPGALGWLRSRALSDMARCAELAADMGAVDPSIRAVLRGQDPPT